MIGQPPQLGRRDRRDRHHADPLRPLAWPTEFVDEFGGRGTGASVVPQQRISNHGAGAVQAHHAVLLGTDRDRSHVVEAAGGSDARLPVRTTTAADRPRCRRDEATTRTARSHRYRRRRRPPCRTGWTSRFPQRVPRLRSYSSAKAHRDRLGRCADGVGSGGRARQRERTTTWCARIAAADSYLATRPGAVGYVLRDRKTGAVYRNSHAADPVWTASTIKLAMVVDLLTRQRAGSIALTDADNRLIAAMLHSSDDDAADTLWSRYGGADHQALQQRLSRLRDDEPSAAARLQHHIPVLGFSEGDPRRSRPADQLHADPAEPRRHGEHRQPTSTRRSQSAVGRLGRGTGDGAGQQGRLVAGRPADGSSTPSASPARGSATRSR